MSVKLFDQVQEYRNKLSEKEIELKKVIEEGYLYKQEHLRAKHEAQKTEFINYPYTTKIYRDLYDKLGNVLFKYRGVLIWTRHTGVDYTNVPNVNINGYPPEVVWKGVKPEYSNYVREVDSLVGSFKKDQCIYFYLCFNERISLTGHMWYTDKTSTLDLQHYLTISRKTIDAIENIFTSSKIKYVIDKCTSEYVNVKDTKEYLLLLGELYKGKVSIDFNQLINWYTILADTTKFENKITCEDFKDRLLRLCMYLDNPIHEWSKLI